MSALDRLAEIEQREDELRDALDGLFAGDTSGCRCGCGIIDENLRARVVEVIGQLDRPALARLIRDMWLSDDAIAQGYGVEDLADFLQWLDDRMGGYVR